MFKNTPSGKSRLTLSDIAKRAGVSIATVSNVLNNKGRMSQETNDRIFRIMQELEGVGVASREEPRQFGSIALISVDQSTMLNHFSFHLHLIQGMQAVLEKRNFFLKLPSCQSLDEFSRETRGTLGAVLIGVPGEPEEAYEQAGLPIVWALGVAGQKGDAVQEDNREIAKIAAEHLLGLGHKVIGYIEDKRMESLGIRGWHLRRFVEAAGGVLTTAAGENIFASTADPMAIDRKQTESLLRQLLDSTPRPTALFVPGDRLCVVVYSLLGEMGVSLPGDLEILSCNNDIPYLASIHPRPATIGLNVDAIGRVVAETILWRIEHPETPPMRILVRTTLVT